MGSSIQSPSFLVELRQSVEKHARLVLDLPDSVSFRCRYYEIAGSSWALHCTIGEEPALDLELGRGVRPQAWGQGRDFYLDIRVLPMQEHLLTEPDTARLLKRLFRRLVRMESSEGDTPLSQLWAAVASYQPYHSIEEWMYRQSSPHEALIRLGFRCNQDCSFCWQDRAWPEPAVPLYRQWIDTFAAAGHPVITFSGGEPTLHPELLDLMTYARDTHGVEVSLQTNAIRLRKAAYLQALISAGLSNVFVSYHSHDATISDAMTRAPGTHAGTQAGIEAALAAGITVSLNCVVERQNVQTLGAHARHIVSAFAEPFPDNPLELVSYSHPCEYFELDDWRSGLVSLSEQQPHLLEAIRVLQGAGVRVEGIGTCGFPPCLFKEEPSLQRSLSRDDFVDNNVAGRVYAPVCANCAMAPHCLGLRSEYLSVYGDEGLSPFTELLPGF